jgi:hypothetical protein
MATTNNLLDSLSRWASSQQENFLTEAFVHLLDHLTESSPRSFAALVTNLSDGVITPNEDTAPDFHVVSQISTDEGAPDIEISGPDSYALVEVKDQSPVNLDQLERYSRLIFDREENKSCLILLTRYPAPPVESSELVAPVRWTQVSRWLTEIIEEENLDDVASYLASQFMAYLNGKGIVVERVGWELEPGLRQLTLLKSMFEEALVSAGVERVYTAYGADFTGVSVQKTGTTQSGYWMTIVFSDPGVVMFTVLGECLIENPIQTWEEAGNVRRRYLNLVDEDVHFFARSVDSQLAIVEEFATSSLADTVYETVGDY